MKYILAIVTLLFTMSAYSEVYVSTGYVNSDIGNGYDLSLGKTLTNYLDVEVSYTDYGNDKRSVSTTTRNHYSTVTTTYQTDYSAKAYGLWAVLNTDVSKVNLYAKAGLVYGRESFNGDTDSDTGYGYGVGIRGKLSNGLGAFAEYREYRKIDAGNIDPDAFIIGINYTF